MNEQIDGFDEIIKDFLAECAEHLDSLDSGFVIMEQDNSNRKTLAEIFRSIHTIKGGAGMLAFSKLEKLAHAAENLLSLLRDNKLHLNSQMITVLLRSVDAIRAMLDEIGQSGTDGGNTYEDIIQSLTELQNPTATATQDEPKTEAQTVTVNTEANSSTMTEVQPADEASVSCELDVVAEPPPHTCSTPEKVSEAQSVYENVTADKQNEEPQAEGKSLAVADATIRINVDLLDKLMNLVGELVLSRNQLLQFITALPDSAFLAVSQRLNLITTELQEGVMKTRMQPIGNVWSKFSRIVRDIATSCNKRVNLVMFGKETELDKTLIEAIKDPLTHIVRNSVDHGIELPEVREKAGKNPEGTITLKAYHEGGHVNIEIHDDGGGLAAEKVKKKALEKGLITMEQAAKMSERDALNLIFLPGLSTAEKVTNISGRGVGMDVVRTNIERINGNIELQSIPGRSTTIKIKIPLTLAIIPALIVTCGSSRYAIPQISLLELVRLEAEEKEGHIIYVKDSPVYKLRGKLLPLIYLNKELSLVADTQEYVDSTINIVILQAGETKFGLIVDSINDTQEIVVKPLSKLLKNQQAFAGATIMGDGKISLILDAVGLARKANLLEATQETSQINTDKLSQQEQQEKHALLLLSAHANNLLAVPLAEVDRIEELSLEQVQLVGEQPVVHYRNAIMPLIALHKEHAITSSKDNTQTIQVIVHSDGNHNFGLVVEQVHDIVEGSFLFDKQIRRRGIIGTSIIDEKIVEIIDIPALMHDAVPEYYKNYEGRVQ